MTTANTIDIRPALSRSVTDLGWLDSKHSFSFGSHQDRSNTGHGLLIVSNDDRVAAGGGFGTHGHRDMEIITWVIEGELEHRDSTGPNGVLYPGLAQRMSAGHGIRHSEMNASSTESVHFVQMWVVPDTVGVDPGYEQLDMNSRLATGKLVPVVSGKGHEGAIKIHQSGAVMWVARLDGELTVTLPDAPFVHLFVAHGAIEVDANNGSKVPLTSGDAARLTDAGPVTVAARQPAGHGAAEILVWESDSEVPR